MMTLVLAFLLTVGEMPRHSETHDVQELRIYQRLDLIHELMPFRASRRLKSDYWKAVACYYKFQENKVIGCDEQLDRAEHDLQVK